MRGPGPAAGAPVAVATLPSRGLPRPVQFSVAKSVQFSTAIDTRPPVHSPVRFQIHTIVSRSVRSRRARFEGGRFSQA